MITKNDPHPKPEDVFNVNEQLQKIATFLSETKEVAKADKRLATLHRQSCEAVRTLSLIFTWPDPGPICPDGVNT